jgi:predicted adenylyl cyclase CyaB
MPRNVEIKSAVHSIGDLLERVSHIADTGPEKIEQDDTFFKCGSGRLKLRAFSDGSGELIFYRREGTDGPRTCSYEIVHTDEVEPLRSALEHAYGLDGRVRKSRTLYRAGRTRIHIDEVEDLGTFVELEVVLGENESESAGAREARQLMKALGIEESELIDRAYVDLMKEKEA